jgi:L-2,4-diaminobutyric acid acetyltransferase
MTSEMANNSPLESWQFVAPDITMGFGVSELIKRCPPLDTNSNYCNLLQCLHFSSTSIAAVDSQNQVAGFISGYLIPDRPDCLFIWQVAVDPASRGKGLALAMLTHLIKRDSCRRITFIETSITLANKPSWALFEKLASKLHTRYEAEVLFDQSLHFHNQHDTEMLVRIGPFKP